MPKGNAPSQPAKPDALRPSPAVLIQAGSALIHFDEFTQPGGHPVDLEAARQCMRNPDLLEWLEGMRSLALLPVKRTGEGS